MNPSEKSKFLHFNDNLPNAKYHVLKVCLIYLLLHYSVDIRSKIHYSFTLSIRTE